MDFTAQLRAIDDANLDAYQFRLVMHYWRVGQCWETIRTTAEKCNMSAAMVHKTRDWLLENGWVEWQPVKVGKKNKMAIALCSPHEQTQQLECSPDEQCSPHEQECSPHEQNPVVNVHGVNAILNEPLILNEPSEMDGERIHELPNDLHPYPDEQMAYEEMLSAVCRVVRETYAPGLRGADDFEGTVQAFIKADITAEQVIAFRDWWALPGNHHYDGRPALKSLRDNIQNSIHPIAHTNGNKGATKNEDGSYNV